MTACLSSWSSSRVPPLSHVLVVSYFTSTAGRRRRDTHIQSSQWAAKQSRCWLLAPTVFSIPVERLLAMSHRPGFVVQSRRALCAWDLSGLLAIHRPADYHCVRRYRREEKRHGSGERGAQVSGP